MSKFTDFVGGAGLGFIPEFPHQNLTGYPNPLSIRRQEGFVGNGDFIELPNVETSSLDYLDVNEVSQPGWPINPNDINVAADAWLGFMLDSSTLYASAIDVTSIPKTIYLASIDSAGVITPIGAGSQLTVDFSDNYWWSNGANGQGTNMYRGGFGSGDFRILQYSDTEDSTREIILNSTTGALIQGTPTLVSSLGDSQNYKYKTQNNVYVGHFDLSTVESSVALHLKGPLGSIRVSIPLFSGVGGSSNTINPLMWKSFISYGYGGAFGGLSLGVKQNTFSGFNDAIDSIARDVGIL